MSAWGESGHRVGSVPRIERDWNEFSTMNVKAQLLLLFIAFISLGVCRLGPLHIRVAFND